MMTRNLSYYRRLQLLLALSFVVSAGSSLAPAANAAPHAAKSAVPKVHRDPFRELKGLETRFYVHEYDRDSPERRLKRLELSIFGSSQAGTNEERLDRLKDAIVSADRENARQLSDRNKQLMKVSPSDSKDSKEGSATKAAATTSSQQFPILDTLEWRVLQKTYKTESLDQRLDRLETSLLGQPSPAISYVDRVDRLKKVVGIDIPAVNPFLSMPREQMGPTSPLGPRQRSMIPKSTYPFATPFAMPIPNRGSSRERTVDEDFQRRSRQDMATILKYMNQFMNDDLMTMPGFSPPGFSSPHGFTAPPMMIPGPTQKAPTAKERETIPPYEDPNSI